MAMRILLEAHDVWFCRTSRPFGATQVASSGGEAHLLPPPPVVFGAVRTALGERHAAPGQNFWADYQGAWRDGSAPQGWFARLGPPVLPEGTDWPKDSLRLRGVLPARVRSRLSESLFPAPAFLLADKEASRLDADTLRRARPRQLGGTTSAAGLLPVVADDAGFVGESRPLLLTERSFAHLLCGRGPADFPRDGLVMPDHLARVEPRVGIARDVGRRTALRGHLYTLDTQRWQARVAFREESSYGLHALLEGLAPADFPAPLALNFGGERRLAWATAEARQGWFEDGTLGERVGQAVLEQGGWWLALATPGYFRAGWRPHWLAEESDGWHARLEGQGGALLDAGVLCGLVSDAPILASGWDLARREPKPVRRLMSAGATWFFRLPEGADRRVPEAVGQLQGACIADEEAHAGCGLAFVGAWGKEGD
jgi:CRISPR-associated protein Cmr3